MKETKGKRLEYKKRRESTLPFSSHQPLCAYLGKNYIGAEALWAGGDLKHLLWRLVGRTRRKL